ncbi:MAG: hypothetical protein JXB23_16370 [Candidatus Aminicenantes bacterium]|nr:hypothetical protein [Candidatus Aminicenantes bacterium]
MTIEALLKIMNEKKATDLHLIAVLRPAIRVDGGLQPITEYEPLTPESAKERA